MADKKKKQKSKERIEKAKKLLGKLHDLELSKKELKAVSKSYNFYKIKEKKQPEVEGEDEKQQYKIHRYM